MNTIFNIKVKVKDICEGMRVITPMKGSEGVMVLSTRTVTSVLNTEGVEKESSATYKAVKIKFGKKHALLRPDTEILILATEEPDEVTKA